MDSQAKALAAAAAFVATAFAWKTARSGVEEKASEPEVPQQTVSEWSPPEVWQPTKSGGKFSGMNRPTAGAREERDLPVGKHNYQLYSMGTPNGQKVTIMLEELRDATRTNKIEYDAWFMNIMKLEQFTSGFVAVNPNSKIPCLYDKEEGIRVFESAHIVEYLAKKCGGQFLGTDRKTQVECMNWVYWLQGSAPYLGGGFGHFYSYAPFKQQYPIDRFAMETKRQLDVLNQRLATNKYLAGDEYTIADIVTYPWYGNVVEGHVYHGAVTFLDTKSYEHVVRWAKLIAARPAVKRGRLVNKTWGDHPVKERHSDADFDDFHRATGTIPEECLDME